MKKLKIGCLILVISICTVSLVFADDLQKGLANWGYNLGIAAKNTTEKSNTIKSSNIVSYVNGIPVYENEIIERIEKNKASLNLMKSSDNSELSPFEKNPFDYVYREKFELYYAKNNGIEVSKEELEEYTLYQKSEWESEELKDAFDQYLIGRGITKEKFFNEIAPAAYEKKILKSKVKEHIFQKAGMNEKSYEEKQKYLEQFYKENIKVQEINKDFITKYNK
nr:hypothetical protein [Sedimentibacter sp.]